MPKTKSVEQEILTRGKERTTKVDNSRTEEKMMTAGPEADKAESPKKKKNIIRVYHAQNASDGGKTRPKRQNNNTERKPAVKPQAAQKPAEEVKKAPAEAPKAAAPAQNNSARPQRQEQSGYNNNRNQNRQNNREGRDNNRDNRGGDNRGRDFRGGERRFSDRNNTNGGQGQGRGGNLSLIHI